MTIVMMKAEDDVKRVLLITSDQRMIAPQVVNENATVDVHNEEVRVVPPVPVDTDIGAPVDDGDIEVDLAIGQTHDHETDGGMITIQKTETLAGSVQAPGTVMTALAVTVDRL